MIIFKCPGPSVLLEAAVCCLVSASRAHVSVYKYDLSTFSTRWQRCLMRWAQSTHTRTRRRKQISAPSTKTSWSRKINRIQKGRRGWKKSERRPSVQWDRKRRRNSNPAWREHPRTIESTSHLILLDCDSRPVGSGFVTLLVRLFQMHHNSIPTPAAVTELAQESRWWLCKRPMGFAEVFKRYNLPRNKNNKTARLTFSESEWIFYK